MRAFDMELIGTGVDIVDNRRIQRIYDRYPEAFAKRILHASELEKFPSNQNKSLYLASRFFCQGKPSPRRFGLGMRGTDVMEEHLHYS